VNQMALILLIVLGNSLINATREENPAAINV